MPRSKTFTEWVRAPTEMKSTPVSGDLAGPLQGEPARGLEGGPPRRDPHRLGHGRRVHVVEQDPLAAGVEQRPQLVEVGDLDLDRAGRGSAARTASRAGTTPPAAITWLSLTIAMSVRLNRWLTPPPQRTAYFCSARQPGSVLRVSSTRADVPSSAVTQAAVAVATPERCAGEVERGALGGQQAADRSGDPHDHVSRGDPGAVGEPVGDLDAPAHHVLEDQRGDPETGHHAGLAGAEHRRAAGATRRWSRRW